MLGGRAEMDSLLKSEKALDILTTISLAQFLIIVAIFIGIGIFIFKFRDRIKDFLEDYRTKENRKEDLIQMLDNHDVEIKSIKEHQEDIQEFYNKQKQYRQQSLEKQKIYDERFEDINEKIDSLTMLIKEQHEETKRLKKNELREKLLSSYRYFTSLETNPKQEWNEMEAEAFWHSFDDYEKLGGNGFMHEIVKPTMERLAIVKII